ncbi:hypothetical protein C5N14_04920 [Micromonospora sp. MW-13]|uniref:PIN domain-containing protein n=1 Tax=unclassified Micromonospora TaxID=2617518 RepID=UPI000E438896|nr:MULTISPECIES: PIN domain-containing protein [unclassified Micromonospora]MCX4474156.1 PIN domain-containing protein [Micromonospora sp. NBC_01655]RGC69748.1 hypothetical protein C5N14_04920 [Micromonospora sp. MW-13]
MIVAVLDACVLVPSVLADTLLRCAEQDLYRPVWSEAILNEVRRNLPTSVRGAKAERRIEVMREHFPEAIVTANLRDFPDHALAPYAIEALHPDDFLCALLDAAPDRIAEVIMQQAEATGRGGRPRLDIDDILAGLAGCRVTRFAHRVSVKLTPER